MPSRRLSPALIPVQGGGVKKAGLPNSIGASLLIRGKKHAASDVLPELKSNQTLKVYASLDNECVRPLLGPAFFPHQGLYEVA